jgi:GWxTD domain-containing protein
MNCAFGVILAFVGAVPVSVDWSAFRAGGDSSRIEFFYGVPAESLLYTASDSAILYQFSVKLEMQGIGNEFRQSGTVRKRARARNFVEVVTAHRSFVDAFSVTAPPGRYRFRISVADTTDAGQVGGFYEDSMELTGFTQGLAVSSLQVGTDAMTDTATGAISVIPNPSHRYPAEGLKTLYVYYEGYNLVPDAGSYEVRTAVLQRKPGRTDTLVLVEPFTRKKHGSSTAYALGVEVESLDRGEYVLGLALTDLSTKQSVVREREFVIGQVEPEYVAPVVRLEGLSPREQKYVEEIHYLATPGEVAYYKRLSDAGKKEYLAKFWKAHNLTEFSRRMETANERFRLPKVQGVQTDRGKVYVKYGEPDAIEQKVIESDTRSREYWHYYNQGYVFIFIDIRGDANYRLAWTNARGEPPTGFELYLSPEEEEQFK